MSGSGLDTILGGKTWCNILFDLWIDLWSAYSSRLSISNIDQIMAGCVLRRPAVLTQFRLKQSWEQK